MDDIKLFAKKEKELKTVVLAVRIYNQSIGMEFAIEKCVITIKGGKWQMTEGIKLTNQEKIKTLEEKENY